MKFEKELSPDVRDKVHGMSDKEYRALLQKALAIGGGKHASGDSTMSDKKLRTQLIRLAHQNPALRADLLPLLGQAKQAAESYFTVVIPPVDKADGELGTQWHADGKTVTRGAYKTKAEADQWAKKNLRDYPYTVKRIFMKKKAAASVLFKQVPGQDGKFVDMAVSRRNQFDWVTDTGDSKWREESKKEGFREFTLPRAEEGFKESNAMIAEATKRLRKKVMLFEKAAFAELKALGFDLRVGPFKPVFDNRNWEDYDFTQDISLNDDVSNWGNPHLTLTWSFRGEVKVTSNWTTTWSGGNGGNETFAQIAVTHAMRQHTDTPAKWEAWVEMRRQYLKEKGFLP